MRLHEGLPRVRYPFMELNVSGIMARIPVLCVVDYGLEFQVLKRLVMFLIAYDSVRSIVQYSH
jgi:hypothetical protein